MLAHISLTIKQKWSIYHLTWSKLGLNWWSINLRRGSVVFCGGAAAKVANKWSKDRRLVEWAEMSWSAPARSYWANGRIYSVGVKIKLALVESCHTRRHRHWSLFAMAPVQTEKPEQVSGNSSRWTDYTVDGGRRKEGRSAAAFRARHCSLSAAGI